MTEVQSEIKKNRLQIEKFILQALKNAFQIEVWIAAVKDSR